MKHSIVGLPLLALVLSLAACRDDSTTDPGTTKPPGTISITRGVLVTKGINSIDQLDTLAFRIGRGSGYSATISVTDFDWEILANQTGFLKPEDDIWQLEATGSGTDIYRIARPGNAPYFAWDFAEVGASGYYKIRTAQTTSDSTEFRIAATGNGHFTVELVSLPGYYLNAHHSNSSEPRTEFIQGQPQEFWFVPWE